MLLGHPSIRQHFFVDVDGVLVFDKTRFQQFVSNKRFLPDSYTSYKNKIGLMVGDEYLTDKKDVVLAWPYKDCVLEGGQDKEDAKRDEIFWNETLAPDQIDRLLSPKVLCNFKRYDKDGEHEVKNISTADNLIIKGNNLLALHTLKKAYAGKVKLIYIDPPYNTGSDSFLYNDKFTHSTWLTFMANRLEVARELLGNSGIIFIQCDDNEQAHLKVLCDEIFGQDNFIDTFVWKNTDNAPALSKKSRKNIEFIHCYEKKKNKAVSYSGRESDNDDAPLLNSSNSIQELKFPAGSIKFNIEDGTYKPGKYESLEIITNLIVENGKNKKEVSMKGRFKWTQDFVKEEIEKETFFIIKTDKMSIRYQRKNSSTMAPDKFIDSLYLSKAIGVSTNEDSKKEIESLKIKFPSYPKPESLMAFLIKAVTSQGDIVMDFFGGSGSTAAAAHKMGRKWITVEQMDYAETACKKRLIKTIRGEQGGISKSVGWQGGGDFVYCELTKSNQHFFDEIMAAKKPDQLKEIWNSMQEKAFLSYKITPNVIQENAADFKELTLNEQKHFLIEVLDKNMLYVPLSEIDDETWGINKKDKALNLQLLGE